MTVEPGKICEELLARDVDFFCGVPDSLLKGLCSYISDNVPTPRNIITANEGNAIGLAAGWHISTGRCACVYMQNSGLGNAVNPLLSLADPAVYSLPMLLIIGWRGCPGMPDEPQHAKQGQVTLSLLEVLGIPHEVLEEDTWVAQLGGAIKTMREQSRPVALVIRPGFLEDRPANAPTSALVMTREQALESVLRCLGEHDVTVATTGKTSREIYELRQRRHQGHSNDFLTVGGMGHASSLAYGIALGSPNVGVWCIDGDGALLMHMGALPVIAADMPGNFKYIVNVNGVHDSVGGQPNAAGSIDVLALLTACGFDFVMEAETVDEIRAAMGLLREKPRGALVIRTRPGSRKDLGRPTTSPIDNKLALSGLLRSMRGEPGKSETRLPTRRRQGRR